MTHDTNGVDGQDAVPLHHLGNGLQPTAKGLLSSKGIQGGVLAFVLTVAPLVSTQIDAQLITDGVNALFGIAAALSAAWGVYGRYTAKESLQSTPE